MQKTTRAHILLSSVFSAMTQDMGIKVDFRNLNPVWLKCDFFKNQFPEQKNTDPKDQRLSFKKILSTSNPEYPRRDCSHEVCRELRKEKANHIGLYSNKP